MKHTIIVGLLAFIPSTYILNFNINQMIRPESKIIKTEIGEIAVYEKIVPESIPIIFLHGVYYDHKLWNYQVERITKHTTIAIDMPFHGSSKDIREVGWDLDDCADMILEILDSIGIEKCIAVGHSWGSMTILRAAAKDQSRFQSLVLCNMPISEGSLKNKLQFNMQHMLLNFRQFYTKQVAKAMFSEQNRKDKPELIEYLASSMGMLSKKEIRKTDRAVIVNADDGQQYFNEINIPYYLLKGTEDYVSLPKNQDFTMVKSGHSSPIECPESVLDLVKRASLENSLNIESTDDRK